MGSKFGERLKLLIVESGCEQQEIAAELGMKTPTFNGYVGGKREPSFAILSQIANYFRVSTDYLIGNSDIRNPYLNHLSKETASFVHEEENAVYLELAKDIKERTVNSKENKKEVDAG